MPKHKGLPDFRGRDGMLFICWVNDRASMHGTTGPHGAQSRFAVDASPGR